MFDKQELEVDDLNHAAKITVVGIGGGGNNAVNRMIENGMQGAEFIVMNTEAQALTKSPAKKKVVIGEKVTRGLGAGADPKQGKLAAEESKSKIRDLLAGSDMVFIAAGMGGGTGTGASPIVAKIAKEQGALTIAVVTSPFKFEGPSRTRFADEGIEELRKHVDSIIVVSNDRALHILGDVPLNDAFIQIDNIIRQGVQSVTDLISANSLINLDFADVRTIMSNKGDALIGIGRGEGDNKAEIAARNALESPLVHGNVAGARSAIVNIASGKQATLHEMDDIARIIRESTSEGINIIFGVSLNEYLENEIIVTVIATDIDNTIPMIEISKVEDKKEDETPIVEEVTDETQVKSTIYDAIRPNFDEEDDDDLPPFMRK